MYCNVSQATMQPLWARIFKRSWSPRINSKEWIPPAYVAWRAGTITLSYSVPSPHRMFNNSSSDLLARKNFDLRLHALDILWIGLKGQCHKMDLFLRSKHFYLYFLCMRWWFSRSFKSPSLPPYTIINIYLLLWHYFLTLKTEVLLKVPFSAVGRCSL